VLRSTVVARPQEAAVTHVIESFGCAHLCHRCLETRWATWSCSCSRAASFFWDHGTREGRQQQYRQHKQLQPTEIIHSSSAFNFDGHDLCAQHSFKLQPTEIILSSSASNFAGHDLCAQYSLKRNNAVATPFSFAVAITAPFTAGLHLAQGSQRVQSASCAASAAHYNKDLQLCNFPQGASSRRNREHNHWERTFHRQLD